MLDIKKKFRNGGGGDVVVQVEWTIWVLLPLFHLQTSALVASEWYMRNNFFPGWARPYEYAAELLTQLDRHEEARDLAR